MITIIIFQQTPKYSPTPSFPISKLRDGTRRGRGMYQINTIFSFLHSAITSSGQMLCLYFADVGFAQEKHTQSLDCPILTADGQWKCVVHQPFVKIQFQTVFFARYSKLLYQCFFIHTRIPMDETSNGTSSTGFHRMISPFRPGKPVSPDVVQSS